MSHTPRPWLIEPHYSNGCELGPYIMTERHPNGTRRIVATVAGAPYLEVDGGENTVANAHLIAAAPELLAACEKILQSDGNIDGHKVVIVPDYEAAVALARAAILRAKGITP